MRLVVTRRQVEEDGGCFKDLEAIIEVVNEGRYASIGIYLTRVRVYYILWLE